jgi:hypothetical protein
MDIVNFFTPYFMWSVNLYYCKQGSTDCSPDMITRFIIASIIFFIIANIINVLTDPLSYSKAEIWMYEIVFLFISAILGMAIPIIAILLESFGILYLVVSLAKFLSNLNLIKIKRKNETDTILINKFQCKSLGKDKYGELFLAEEKDNRDDQYVFVKVKNSTKKYGMRENYYIIVPPDFRNGNHTPKEAVAWTFNLKESEYNPELES